MAGVYCSAGGDLYTGDFAVEFTLMWGAQEKSGGHIKKFSAGGACAGIVPPTCKLLPTPLLSLT